MVMYEAGMLARSKAGHDKAQMYIIKEHSSILKKRKKNMCRSFMAHII